MDPDPPRQRVPITEPRSRGPGDPHHRQENGSVEPGYTMTRPREFYQHHSRANRPGVPLPLPPSARPAYRPRLKLKWKAKPLKNLFCTCGMWIAPQHIVAHTNSPRHVAYVAAKTGK